MTTEPRHSVTQQHHVTLEIQDNQAEELRGKPFACPLCGMVLPVKIARTQKPYCVCLLCGIQIFFRGKAGIKRLRDLLRMEKPVAEEIPGSTVAVNLYNQLEKLKRQRDELEQQQGIIFKDHDLANAVIAIEAEIKKVQSSLEKVKRKAEKQR